ncbi:MAG: hypothetical protein IPM91_13850 [Bacteroidetes bacterium]|nr:hypothetical protein [Bacteroidota bacterium]
MKKHLALTVIMLLAIPFILSAGTGNSAYKLPEGITSSDYMSRTIIFRVKPSSGLYVLRMQFNLSPSTK